MGGGIITGILQYTTEKCLPFLSKGQFISYGVGEGEGEEGW